MKASFPPIQSAPPLVTAICPCYNHARFVEESLDSIRNQTYPNIELVIIDDCSSDSSVAAIRAWIDRHRFPCTFIQHSANQGVCKTLNDALAHAHGKYIAPTSADDVWLPDKISDHVALMETQSEEVGVLYGDAFTIDENGTLLSKMFIEQWRNFDHMPEGDLHDILWDGNFLPTMLVRKSCYDRVGAYDESLYYDDWDMWLRISKHYKFIFHPVVSSKYRIVSTSMMRTGADKIQKSCHQIFLKHLEAGTLPAKFRQLALELLMFQATAAYQRNSAEARNLFRKLRRLAPALRINRISLCCAVGLTYESYLRIDALSRRFARIRT